jgi:hypothetical protein
MKHSRRLLADEVRPICGSTPFFGLLLIGQLTGEKVHFFKRVFDIYFAPEIIKICCDFGRVGP